MNMNIKKFKKAQPDAARFLDRNSLKIDTINIQGDGHLSLVLNGGRYMVRGIPATGHTSGRAGKNLVSWKIKPQLRAQGMEV